MTTRRPRKIGGTDIACLFHLNRYGRGPRAVYERIVEGKDTESNPAMERGMREEPRIRQLFVERTGLVLEPHPGIIESPDYEFAIVSPDDFTHDAGEPLTLEYKSVSIWSAKKWGDDSTDALPEDYAMQLHWAMAITKRPAGRLFAAFGEDLEGGIFDIKFTRLYYLRRDPDIESALLRRAAWFWENHIVKKVSPPPDPKPTKRTRKKETV